MRILGTTLHSFATHIIKCWPEQYTQHMFWMKKKQKQKQKTDIEEKNMFCDIISIPSTFSVIYYKQSMCKWILWIIIFIDWMIWAMSNIEQMNGVGSTIVPWLNSFGQRLDRDHECKKIGFLARCAGEYSCAAMYAQEIQQTLNYALSRRAFTIAFFCVRKNEILKNTNTKNGACCCWYSTRLMTKN